MTAFGAVFLAELPDKTMIATLLLTARSRRPLLVWIGVCAAFTVHVTVAVLAGSLLSQLPDRVVALLAGVVFAIGGVVLLFGGSDDDEDESDEEHVRGSLGGSGGRVVLAAFATILLAELGDLTQLATAGMAAKSDEPILVGIGALMALATVAALATTVGGVLGERMPVRVLRRAGGTVFLALAAWSLIDALSA
jgi:Ca2+/H+ antiporter, TMEM165/GDT1 family